MRCIPERLREISGAPKRLFISGSDLEEDFCGIAIVGTRRPTAQGADLAEHIAGRIAEAGYPVISGLALGIDSAAHIGCLNSGGRTVAVLGGGLDRLYPGSNNGLAKRILDNGGTILTEYPPGTPPLKHQFLARNRIVAGLSVAVIVIEAPERSGSLSTAGFAADAGRDVLVFPGPVSHPNYKGSHALIRDGAGLITSFEDIAEDLRLPIVHHGPKTLPALSATSASVFKNITDSPVPLTIDKITLMTRLEPQEIAASITELLIEGLISESIEGYSAKAGF